MIPTWFRRLARFWKHFPARPVPRPRRPAARLDGWDRLEERVTPALFIVTSLSDAGPGSLREAIDRANADPEHDQITFAPELSRGTIQLVTAADSAFGPTALLVRSPVTIAGDGQTISRSPGAGPLRLFRVTTEGFLALEKLVLDNGLALGGSGGAGSTGGGGAAGMGGAIYNQGELSIRATTFTHNRAVGGAGGAGGYYGGPGGGGTLSSNGTSGTWAWPYGATAGSPSPAEFGSGGAGGGVGGFGGGGGGGAGSQDNAGFGGGGGDGSLAGGGGAGMGGAVFNQGGRVTIVNATFTQNSARGGDGGTTPTGARGQPGAALGGALFNLSGTVTVFFSTFARNSVEVARYGAEARGGAVYSVAYPVPGASDNTAELTLANSILAYSYGGGGDLFNFAPPGSTVRLDASAPNIVTAHGSSGSGLRGGGISSQDPRLDLLRFNGGPVPTIALQAGSPAIDAAAQVSFARHPETDQRGQRRDAQPDLGAYEFVYLGPGTPDGESAEYPEDGAADPGGLYEEYYQGVIPAGYVEPADEPDAEEELVYAPVEEEEEPAEEELVYAPVEEDPAAGDLFLVLEEPVEIGDSVGELSTEAGFEPIEADPAGASYAGGTYQTYGYFYPWVY